MKARFLILLPVLILACQADTIRLRNGTELHGKVISETGDSYIVMVQVTKSIRDQRTIAKSEVLEIVAEKEDLVAFEKLSGLVPAPDGLDAAHYDQRIEAIEDFMSAHSESRQLKEAAAMLKELDAEREVVSMGGIKFDGELIEAADRKAKAYPLDAMIAAKKVRDAGDARDLLGALRAWDQLEANFVSSKAYLDTVPYILQVMRAQHQTVDRSLASLDERLKQRADGIARIDERDRSRTERAIAEENAAFKARVEEEKKAGVKWLSLDAFEKAPLEETKRRLDTDIKRLESLDPSTLPDGDAAWTNAWTVLSGSPTGQEASTAISAANSARIPKTYIDILTGMAPAR